MSATCRQRKVICPGCGNTARQTRSWMLQGLLACPCGGKLRPESPADLAYIGLIGQEDMSQAAWNAICRELGWPIILNQGQDASARFKGREIPSTLTEKPSKPVCAYAGCGRWVSVGDEYCHAHAPAQILEPAMPF